MVPTMSAPAFSVRILASKNATKTLRETLKFHRPITLAGATPGTVIKDSRCKSSLSSSSSSCQNCRRPAMPAAAALNETFQQASSATNPSSGHRGRLFSSSSVVLQSVTSSSAIAKDEDANTADDRQQGHSTTQTQQLEQKYVSPVLSNEAKLLISKEDEHQEESKRRRLSEVLISEVLKAKHSYRWADPVIRETATVKEAIVACIEGGLSAMIVLKAGIDEKRVVGLLTSRDMLRIMAAGIKQEGVSEEAIMKTVVGEFMTPISRVVYGRPEETVGMCRTVMAKVGIKCLPILSREGRVEGLITARDMTDFGLSAAEKGGKKSYLTDVAERVGLSSDTSMADPPPFLKAHLALKQSPLYANFGVSALPHPFKTAETVGYSQRDIGSSEYTKDMDLSEDAHFLTTVELPDEKGQSLRPVTYFGVADGVGSWREYGVDPREFSRRLMEECQNTLQEAAAHMENSKDDDDDAASRLLSIQAKTFQHGISPAEIMEQAYERVKAGNVIGSATACIAMFDSVRHQLHFSNLGDCGIVVLRHIDSDVAGSLKRDRLTPRSERKSDMRVAFVSQQQLKSFNHPFQLGWTGEELPESEWEESSFKLPSESCTTSIHIRRGDIIIMATDGLYDNVDVDDICAAALQWEQSNGFIRGGDISARERRWNKGESLTLLSAQRIGDLTETLCQLAQKNSVDQTKDSPFAILAKENDIMWAGGMPDDCTVLAIHVVGRDSKDTTKSKNQ